MKFKVDLSAEGRYCNTCNGEFWNESDNVVTQAAVKEKFGIIPNNCVNGEGGVVHCPYAIAMAKAKKQEEENARAKKAAAKNKQ